MWIGRSTYLANNRPEAPRRDSTAQRRRRPRCAQPARCARLQRSVAARPEELGGHRLLPYGHRWRCAICRRSVSWQAPAWAAGAETAAAAGRQDGGGHVRFLSDDVVWCDRCGSYATSSAVGLAKPCPGRPQAPGTAARRRLLRNGLHPVSCRPFDSQPLPESSARSPMRPSPCSPSPALWGAIPSTRTVACRSFGDLAGIDFEARSRVARDQLAKLRKRVIARERAARETPEVAHPARPCPSSMRCPPVAHPAPQLMAMEAPAAKRSRLGRDFLPVAAMTAAALLERLASRLCGGASLCVRSAPARGPGLRGLLAWLVPLAWCCYALRGMGQPGPSYPWYVAFLFACVCRIGLRRGAACPSSCVQRQRASSLTRTIR